MSVHRPLLGRWTLERVGCGSTTPDNGFRGQEIRSPTPSEEKVRCKTRTLPGRRNHREDEQ
jgi:hypothetical protein